MARLFSNKKYFYLAPEVSPDFRVGQYLHSLRVLVLATAALSLTITASAETRCDNPAAILESAQGVVEWTAADKDSWQSAEPGAVFCHGDKVRILEQRAALRLANDTLVRLRENSLVTLLPEEKGFWFSLVEGAAHFLSRTPKQFTIKAPYLNAAVDGTEFVVSAQPQENRVAVVEGAVRVSNDLGEVRLSEGTQTSATANSAPSAVQSIRLRDAAEWVLYYPPLIVQGSAPADIEALIQQENYSGALSQLTSGDLTPTTTALAASLAYNTGNTIKGAQLLQQALENSPAQAEALALQALRTLIDGDSDGALRQTTQLVETHPQNPSALLAHAYALQSRGKIEEALQINLQAQTLIPNNLFVMARTAELQLSVGNTRAAQKLINQALQQAPQHSRVNTLAGFVALNRFATGRAQNHFQTAITSDSNEPLARLGLALALIQKGKIEQGREQMEMAVLLDPGSSLLRSYLGKTYATQNQNDWADTQYRLAKNLDPNDPTPWFYQAHLKYAENKPGEALRLISSAIEKNDNRAVYRSRMLLDSDAAARSANLTHTYETLGFTETAKNTAALAASRNPTDFATHHALVKAYSGDQKAQTLRAREALMTRLLAPLGAQELSVGVGETGLHTYTWISPSKLGVSEYSSLFSQRSFNGSFTSFAGSQDSNGYDWQIQASGDRVSFSGGQYDYETDGYRSNNNLDVKLTEGILHYQASENLKLLAISSKRTDSSGDLLNPADSIFFDESLRRNNTTHKSLLALLANINKDSRIATTLSHYDYKLGSNFQVAIPPNIMFDVALQNSITQNRAESQLQVIFDNHEATLGIINEQLESKDISIPEASKVDADTNLTRIYTSFTLRPSSEINYLIGTSYRDQKNSSEVTQTKDSGFEYEAGLFYTPKPNINASFASWRSTSEFLPQDGNLKSSHIFNINTTGNPSSFTSQKNNEARLNWKTKIVHINLATSLRDYKTPTSINSISFNQETKEKFHHLNIASPIGETSSIYADYQYTKNEQQLDLMSTLLNIPVKLRNSSFKIGASTTIFGFRFNLEAQDFYQELKYVDPSTAAEDVVAYYDTKENGVILNSAITYKSPDGQFQFKLEGYNLTDRKISAFNRLLHEKEESWRTVQPIIAPSRTALLTLTFNLK